MTRRRPVKVGHRCVWSCTDEDPGSDAGPRSASVWLARGRRTDRARLRPRPYDGGAGALYVTAARSSEAADSRHRGPRPCRAIDAERTRLAAAAAFRPRSRSGRARSCIWLPGVLFGVRRRRISSTARSRVAMAAERATAPSSFVADIAFVLAASATGATLGLVPWLAPMATLAFTSCGRIGGSRPAGAKRRRSRHRRREFPSAGPRCQRARAGCRARARPRIASLPPPGSTGRVLGRLAVWRAAGS